MKSFARFIGTCLILAALGFGGAKVWQNLNPQAQKDSPELIATQSYTVDSQALSAIQGTIDAHPEMDISISLTDLQTGKTYNYGDDSSFTAASIGKLITAAAFIDRVEKGTAKLTDIIEGETAQTHIQNMLVKSDNEAWAAMKRAITLEGQQVYAHGLELKSYDAQSNTISGPDVGSLLTKLASGKLCSNSHTKLLLSYMKEANYRGYIVAAIPDSVSVYHKVGLLDDRIHDAAIIKKGDRSFVLVAFTKARSGSYDFSQGPPIFGDITNASLQAFL